MEVGFMKKYLLVFFSILLILSACGSSDDKTVVNETEEEANDEIEESDVEENDQDNANSDVMKLGDTGFIDDGINQYEITPTSVEMFTERDGIIPNNDDEVFVLIDYTVKNIGEEGFEEEDILIG